MLKFSQFSPFFSELFYPISTIFFFSFFADPRTLMRAASSEEQNLRQPENPAFKGQRPSSSAEFCPSCREAFDCGKKRRLIDSCGHERCYTCMFSKELCSLCTIEGMCEEIFLFKKLQKGSSINHVVKIMGIFTPPPS